jgi:hypothetical protein
MKECDLVMKGGITSGIVYPPAILELKEEYRFKNIGGASVGAIAAVVTAAAEFGRQKGTGGFGPLDEVSRDLRKPGFVQSLFQPRRELRSIHGMLIEATSGSKAAALRIAMVLLRTQWLAAIVFGGAWIAAIWWAVASGHWPALLVGGLLWLLVAVPIVLQLPLSPKARGIFALLSPLGYVLWPILGVLVWTIARSVRALYGPQTRFGICTGMPSGSGDAPALTPWLHEKIQQSAGVTAPLTFGDLEQVDVRLKVMSTDLSLARPLTLPNAIADYAFNEQEMRELFPPDVVDHLVASSDPTSDPGLNLRRLRRPADLPVLVGFRLSMSFPALFTAVPMWGIGPRTGGPGSSPATVQHWLSDGGIGSNFPIHFFDAWFPSRPTFGLNLGSYPQTPEGTTVAGAEEFDLPTDPTTEPELPWVQVKSAFAYGKQIIDTMENWRDTLQAELPGFRERVCRINLGAGEGGLNIGMRKEAIENLIRKGRTAGHALAHEFDWPQHRFTRYVLMMQMLQRRLIGETDRASGTWIQGAGRTFSSYAERLAAGDPEVKYHWGRDPTWCATASAQTVELLRRAAGWVPPPNGNGPPGVDLLDGGDPPIPRGVMRIVPPI